ncbi:MAG: alanine--tRNA ligase [Polyangiales bacterium]
MPRTADAIRRAFLDHFAARGHTELPSGPLVPQGDATLMFANAGMVQFKDALTGKEKRQERRATTAQKCMRISGKHNDLENVGVTARHHTFFEMLGNFSFGDYFKEEAITWAWQFVHEVLQLPPERLVVSIFGGEGGVPADEEAAQLWRRIAGLPPERIHRCGMADNFWQMGETGPCGPCTEIHCFLGDGAPDPRRFGEEPSAAGAGWVEIWNLVFVQFERDAAGQYTPLKAPSIDTGAGLERLAAVQQGVLSNYDTDLLRPLVDQVEAVCGKRYGGSQAPDDVSMRVIADHARAAAFVIADGVFPDRDGRAYVLRRVMRRAIRHGHRLGIDVPFLHEVTRTVVDRMAPAYPELSERRALILDITLQEEQRFRRTLRRGLELLQDNRDWGQGAGGQKVLPGSVAFRLYDTYGFPLDLQEVIGAESGFGIDASGFEAALDAARQRSAGSKVGDKATDAGLQALAQSLGATDFVGYERLEAETEVCALLQAGQQQESLEPGAAGLVVLRATPCYAESGGQVGDRGRITGAAGLHACIEATTRPTGGMIVHQVRVMAGRLRVGARVNVQVDRDHRLAVRRHHSATHLLHYALRQVLGPQAMQKGSRVGPDGLRFDYSGAEPLDAAQVAEIETIVNACILDNTPITTEVLPMAAAKAAGAIGIFEEKYGEVVRMLRIGPSLELCGGTHAERTGEIGLFKLRSDSAVAAGVRRIEAVVAAAARQYVDGLEAAQARLSARLKVPTGRLEARVQQLLEQHKVLQQQVQRLQQQLTGGAGRDWRAQARRIGAQQVLGAVVPLSDVKAMRELADQLRDELAPAVVLLGGKGEDGKAMLVCAVSKALNPAVHAGKVVQQAASLVGGRGGGRPDFAQAGGSDAGRLTEAVAQVYAWVENAIPAAGATP